MMSVTKFVVLVLVSAMLCMAKGNDVSNEVQKRSDCSKSVILQGCFYNTKSQLKEELLITDREAYSQIKIQWDNYPEYLQGLVCRCAKAAKERKFAMFGIKYWGECWGISGGEEQIKSLKSSTGCQTTKYTSPCLKESNKYCTGMKNTAYIYKVSNPLDGGYNQWSSWSKCSKDCDNGTSTRTRSCTNPVRFHRGQNCDHLGPAEEIRKCNEQSCYPFPNKDCGTVKRAGRIDILNASDPIEFCTPKEFLEGLCPPDPTTFCRVVFPSSHFARKGDDMYVIQVWMYNQGNIKGPARSSAGIMYNAQDIDNFEMMYLSLKSGPCYHLVSATYSKGIVTNRKTVKEGCTPKIKGEQWIRLYLFVDKNEVSLSANGFSLASTTRKLPMIARGGVIVKNGEGNVVEYAGYNSYIVRI